MVTGHDRIAEQMAKTRAQIKRGMLKSSAKRVAIALMFYAALYWSATVLTPFDQTDDDSRQVRSGMALRTDHGTGCQYLQTWSGGITPRLDGTGRQICKSGN